MSEQVTEWVPLEDILQESRLQVRRKLDPGVVARYAKAYQNGQVLPPIKLGQVKAALVLLDGWHRMEALKLVGARDVEAVIVETTLKEAHWLAAQANLTHGLQLKNKELRRVFVKYVRAGQHLRVNAAGRRGHRSIYKSYREMAADLAGQVSYQTVRRWMQLEFPKIFRAIGDCEHSHGRGEEGKPEQDSDAHFYNASLEAIQNAWAAFRGVQSLEDRGRIVSQARELLRAMEAEGYTEEDSDF